MNTHGETSGMSLSDFLAYVSSGQFAADVEKAARACDELAVRQGAMGAVEETARLKARAAALKAQAKQMVAEAGETVDALLKDARHQKDLSEQKLQEIERFEGAVIQELTKREDALKAREFVVSDREKAVSAHEVVLASRKSKLDDAEAALNQRIKSFQEKVAALNA